MQKGIEVLIGEKGVLFQEDKNKEFHWYVVLSWDPEILILDDLLSAVDKGRCTERKIIRNIQKVRQGKTKT